jgi:hypothetical protein
LASLSSIITPQLLQANAKSLQGLLFTDDYPTVQGGSATADFTTWMGKTGKSSEVSSLSLGGWSAGTVLGAAIKGVGASKATRESVLNFLNTQSITGLTTLPDPLSLQNAPKNPAFDRLANPGTFINVVNNGKPENKEPQRLVADYLNQP